MRNKILIALVMSVSFVPSVLAKSQDGEPRTGQRDVKGAPQGSVSCSFDARKGSVGTSRQNNTVSASSAR